MLLEPDKHRLRTTVYIGGFFLNAAVAFAAYVNSSFIEQFIGEGSVGLIYILNAVLSILISFNTDALIKRLGDRTVLIILALGNLLAIGGLLAYRATPVAVIFFVIYSVLNFLIGINLDLYLEEISDDRITGKIRGFFLMLSNLAWLSSPLLAGFLLERSGFSAIYTVSGLTLIPLIFLIVVFLADIPHERYEHAGIFPTAWRLWRARGDDDADLRHDLELDFLLQFFYALMIVYTPIYLNQYIGLGWESIGLIFTIALVPFVILDFFLGHLADNWLGEKELLVTGLLITSFSTLLIPLLTVPSIFWWAVILFMTRVGAATLELSKEAYLFKKISGRDIDVVFLSRNLVPLAYIAAPLVATLWLTVFPFAYLFALLGFILLLGLPAALALKDTR